MIKILFDQPAQVEIMLFAEKLINIIKNTSLQEFIQLSNGGSIENIIRGLIPKALGEQFIREVEDNVNNYFKCNKELNSWIKEITSNIQEYLSYDPKTFDEKRQLVKKEFDDKREHHSAKAMIACTDIFIQRMNGQLSHNNYHFRTYFFIDALIIRSNK